MRTVRSAAQARNQPRGHLALVVIAILMVLAALVVRANAAPADRSPADEEDDDDRGSPASGWFEEPIDAPSDAPRIYVPITNAMIQRVVTFAPPVANVVAAAYRAAAIADDPTTGWRRRSRMSALIPFVSVRAGQNQAWREVDDPTISHGVAFDVRASWHLEQLLFDPDEPRIAMIDVARRRERRRVAAHTIRVYFAWVAARAAAAHDVRAILDAEEKAAELDALTAGWFSEALAKRAESR